MVAHQEANKDLFYEFEVFKYKIQEETYIHSKLYPSKETWDEKWKIDLFTGKSPYFGEAVKPDDF